jgi:hypothetical protein
MEKLDFQKIAGLKDKLFDSRSWQRLLSRSWFLKGLSLCLAAMLWYFVGGKDTVDKNVMIPIEILNLPRELVISNQFKKEIEVTVSGPRSLILELSNRAVTRQIDLSSATPGTMVISNANNSIPVPRGIKVLRVQPSSVILSLDKLIQKHFPIIPTVAGKVAAGHVLKKLKMDPEVITITGPQTVLSQVDQLHTGTINIEGISESQQRQVPLKLDPAIVDLIGETSVTAYLQLGVETVEKKISDLPVVAILDGVQQQVDPATVTVTANVPKAMLKNKTNLKKLFTVTATEVAEDGKMKVMVIPGDEANREIAVVAVDPVVVTLVPEKSEKKQEKNTTQNQHDKSQSVNTRQGLTKVVSADEGKGKPPAEAKKVKIITGK